MQMAGIMATIITAHISNITPNSRAVHAGASIHRWHGVNHGLLVVPADICRA